MAHLKAYINGTPGAKDGEEITDATTIAAIMTNSQASRNGVGGNYLPICLRCEEGFKATNVRIVGGTNVGYLNVSYGSNSYAQGFATLESFKAVIEDSKCRFTRNSMYSSTFALNITDTNFMIIFCVAGTEADNNKLAEILSLSYVEEAV